VALAGGSARVKCCIASQLCQLWIVDRTPRPDSDSLGNGMGTGQLATKLGCQVATRYIEARDFLGQGCRESNMAWNCWAIEGLWRLTDGLSPV